MHIERLTHLCWPKAPRDYSLATVGERWAAIEPIYHAYRAKERQDNRAALAAKGTQQ